LIHSTAKKQTKECSFVVGTKGAWRARHVGFGKNKEGLNSMLRLLDFICA
jgi:hypothetical protein